jgi:hypothetical protein
MSPASDWLMSTWSIRTVSTSAGSTLKRRHSPRGSHLTRLKASWAWASRVGGRPPHNRDDLFISLCDPGWAESTGFKRGVNLPGLRVLTDSTSHEHLPAWVAWTLPGAFRSESERREILRHNADVGVYVEYSSKTLTGFAQLCWKCTVASPHECRPPWTGNGSSHRLSSLPRGAPVATQSHPVC